MIIKYRTTVNQDIARILFTNLPRNLVSPHCIMSGHLHGFQVLYENQKQYHRQNKDISNTSWFC